MAQPNRPDSTPMPMAKAETPNDTTEVKSGAQERRVHDRRAQRVFLVEFGVGLALGHVQRVVVDDVGLREGRERSDDRGAGQERGVLGDGDLFGGELRADNAPDHTSTDDHDDGAENSGPADELEDLDLGGSQGGGRNGCC